MKGRDDSNKKTADNISAKLLKEKKLTAERMNDLNKLRYDTKLSEVAKKALINKLLYGNY